MWRVSGVWGSARGPERLDSCEVSCPLLFLPAGLWGPHWGGVFLLEDPWRGPEEACLSWPARGAASTLGHVSLLFKLV